MPGGVKFAVFELDLQTLELRKSGIRLRVPEQSLEILAMLVAKPGEVVTRDEIRARLWPNGTIVEFENSVNVAIRRLREALSDSAETPRFIETLPRRGYRFLAPIEFLPSDAAPPHYRILGEAGRGAMGIVYKAEDVRLHRRVALKFLPEELADEPTALERFRREAQSLAALNHPGICTLYGIEEQGRRPCLVMEYLEGRPLSRLLGDGPLKLGQALDLAIQIADAVAAAHRAGIIHRDLKPSNVMVGDDGRVKLVDFGLAKPLPRMTHDTVTVTMGPDAEGAIVGTVAYMSPEQAQGLPVDARSDIFSFGAVLYEMLTAQRAFTGETKVSTLAAILRGDPRPPSELSTAVPRKVERIVHRCLHKDAGSRYQHMADAKLALEDAVEDSEPAGPAMRSQRHLLLGWLVVAGAILLVGVLAYFLRSGLPGSGPPVVVNFKQLTNDGQRKTGSLVTDGQRIYFASDETSQLFEVSTNGGDSVPLFGNFHALPLDISAAKDQLLVTLWDPQQPQITSRALPLSIVQLPGGAQRRVGDIKCITARWSPEGSRIAFTTGRELWTCGSDGSRRQKLATFSEWAWSPRWAADGRRLRVSVGSETGASFGLWEVSADGGGARRILEGWDQVVAYPGGCWMPGGRWFLLHATGGSRGYQTTNLWAMRDRGKPVQLTFGPLEFFGSERSLTGDRVFAVGRRRRGELIRYDKPGGHFVPCLQGLSAEGVEFSRDGEWVAFVSYPEGSLWRRKRDGSAGLQLTSPPMQAYLPRWSPGGDTIAFMGRTDGGSWKVYTVAVGGGAPQQLIPGPGPEADPNWSPDGQRLIFSPYPWEVEKSRTGVYVLDLENRSVSKLPGSEGMFSARWTPDGMYIIAVPPDGGALMLFDVAGQRWRKLCSRHAEFPSISRDGKFVYFGSPGDETFICRASIPDGRVENLASLSGLNRGGLMGPWIGLAPDDSPMILRDLRTEEIYALELANR